MATQSRARTFYATAKALRAAADNRFDDARLVLDAPAGSVVGFDLAVEEAEPVAAPDIDLDADQRGIAASELLRLHEEYRWADSRMMQASELLVEAQEARRKDLVALARMRRDLKKSFAAERAYIDGQLRMFAAVLPRLWTGERELTEIVDGGAATADVIRELAALRAERKLMELATAQAHAQIAHIDDNEAALDHDVAAEAYDRQTDGESMRELARMRSAKTRLHRAAMRARSEARALLGTLGIDTTYGDVTAIAAFLAAEHEGDARAADRCGRIRARQIERELAELPAPTNALIAGLRHPMSWMRARRLTQ